MYAKPKGATPSQSTPSPSPASSTQMHMDPRERRPPQLPTQSPQASPRGETGPPLKPPKPGESNSNSNSQRRTSLPPQAHHNGINPYEVDSRYSAGTSQAGHLSPTASPAQHLRHQSMDPRHYRYAQSLAYDASSGHRLQHSVEAPSSSRSVLHQPTRAVSLSAAETGYSHASPPPSSNGLQPPPIPPIPQNLYNARPVPKSYDEEMHQQMRNLEIDPAAAPLPPGAPAPPRPPNPELLSLHARLHAKLTMRLQYLQGTLGESQKQLQLLNSDLERGEPAIRDEMARLEAVRDVCRATGDGLDRSVNEAREWTQKLKEREDPNPDEMVFSTSIVGNQLSTRKPGKITQQFIRLCAACSQHHPFFWQTH